MKRLLLITHHFPPDVAIGGVRPAEFARCLPRHGWRITVLTVSEKYCGQVDHSKYDLNGMEVLRTRKLPGINDIYMRLKGLIPAITDKRSSPASTKKEWFSSGRGDERAEPLRSMLVRYYNSLLVYLPDKETGWVIPALLKGMRLIKDERIDAIFTTSPPHSVHLIGTILKFITKKPWIADFRDPWAVELKPVRSRSRLSEAIEERMERAVVKNCDYALSVTGPMTQRLKDLYPKFSSKFITIPNGYNSKNISEFFSLEKAETFTITYVGSLYFGRDPSLFLKAVSDVIENGTVNKNDIRIRLIGDCRYSDNISVESMVKKIGLENVVTFVDHIPHREALKEITRSHVLLLMAPRQPLQIPGKVYEYIGLRSAILAVCEDGATKDLLKDYPLASVVSPDDLDGMKEAIHSFLKESRNGGSEDKLKSFDFNKYERGSLAEELAGLLDNTVKAIPDTQKGKENL